MATPSTVVRTSGGLTSTNAQIKVACGFKPGVVWVVNQTNNTMHVWFAGMPANSGLRISGSAAGAAFVTTSGTQLFSDSSGEGFTIEPGGPLNPTGSHNLYWSAFRGDGALGNI